MRNVVLEGDVLEQLRKIPEKSVQTCVTSPPYWGLRDYGHRRWFGGTLECEHGGTLECEHEPADSTGYLGHRGNKGQVPQTKWANQQDYPQHEKTGPITTCQKCGAWYGQIGLEETPEAYVSHIVEVFQEVKRVLRDDGTLWLNLGDSYCSTGPGTMGDPIHQRGIFAGVRDDTAQARAKFRPETPQGMKPKDLVGIPWMVAFALRSDGWYLRSDIIWHKGNVMPESVQDRPTKCHEYIFLLTKSAKYFYDIDAIREPHSSSGNVVPWQDREYDQTMLPEVDRQNPGAFGNVKGIPKGIAGFGEGGRNRRTVWSINPKPYKGAHFATFPEELPEVCIKAGSKPGAIILDPFAGSGTTLAVAKYLRRDYIGIELNPEYIRLIEERVRPAEETEQERQGFDLMSSTEMAHD